MGRLSFFLIACLTLFNATSRLSAQLDSIHWLPPMHARADWGPQYLYITTPEKTPFEVVIRNGAGLQRAVITVSNAKPGIFELEGTNSNGVLVPESSLHQALKGQGLVIEGKKKFYVNFRCHSFNLFHAGDLSCKGTAALGKQFRIGHLIQSVNANNRRSNFIGVMATEDNTAVSLSEYKGNVEFRVNGSSTTLSAPIKIALQKGESVVFAQYLEGFTPGAVGLIGSLLSSDKPVAVNCGSWLGSPASEMSNDIGIDQIVPYELVGEEYILCKGNGSEILEIPYVVAHANGTQVWINGNTTPAATLNAGDHFQIGIFSYTASGNMHIRCSKPAFVYQMVGGVAVGGDQERTAGLIFVPPVSCGIPNAVDNIYLPNQIGSMRLEGGLMIVAMRDSAVHLRIDGVETSLGIPANVPGAPEFVTYRDLALFDVSNPPELVSVEAEGAVQLALFGRNGAAGFGAFYSGFSKLRKAKVQLTLNGDGVCPDTLVAEGFFDGLQWMLGDSILQYGPERRYITYTPGQYVASGYLGVCRRTDFSADTQQVAFQSPHFPYSLLQPHCFGLADGQIAFGKVAGGIAPYQYSIDDGKTYAHTPVFDHMRAGIYRLVARDSTGCYNRPLTIELEQPDSFIVELEALHMHEPLHPGDGVRLSATPNRPVVSAQWLPHDDAFDCRDCLEYVAHPLESGDFAVHVTDAEGCIAGDTLRLVIEPPVFAPNAINPDAESENSRFTLYSKEPLTVLSLQIFDRWGDKVFENRQFPTNDMNAGWDGTVRGKRENPGVFVYVAEVSYADGRRFWVRGDLALVW